MKGTFKKIAAAAAAVSIMCTAGISVSAATAEDVVAAARGAGFQEQYVQVLENYLKVNKFTESQYDILVSKISSVGSDMDDMAMKYFGLTVDEMKGGSGSGSSDSGDSGSTDIDLGDEKKNQFISDLVDKMTGEEIMNSINKIVDAGKQMGLDITVEKKGEKNFVMTVRDADGNVQLVTPVGKLVDTTGVEAASSDGSYTWVAALCAGMLAVGGTGAFALNKYNKKAGE